MLIPSIDLMGGRVVQLQQGERLAIATDDLSGWIDRFRGFPVVQVIDLDAAMGRGENAGLVKDICCALPCQVGGGVRTPERAAALVAAGARRVIVGSALFPEGRPDLDRASAFASEVGRDAFVAAVDGRGGRVVVHGWKDATGVTPAEAVAALDAVAGAFLYTHVETEGLLTGLDVEAVLEVRRATTRPFIAAGGIRTIDEVEHLDEMGIDAVVGMALYTGLIDPAAALGRSSGRGNGPGSPAV